MPSMKCYHCGKIKRCDMVVTERDRTTGCDDHDGCERGPCKVQRTEYLCKPCQRELGYREDSSR